jgi:hypothetical protein
MGLSLVSFKCPTPRDLFALTAARRIIAAKTEIEISLPSPDEGVDGAAKHRSPG